jgi:hypothetical protein
LHVYSRNENHILQNQNGHHHHCFLADLTKKKLISI